MSPTLEQKAEWFETIKQLRPNARLVRNRVVAIALGDRSLEVPARLWPELITRLKAGDYPQPNVRRVMVRNMRRTEEGFPDEYPTGVTPKYSETGVLLGFHVFLGHVNKQVYVRAKDHGDSVNKALSKAIRMRDDYTKGAFTSSAKLLAHGHPELAKINDQLPQGITLVVRFIEKLDGTMLKYGYVNDNHREGIISANIFKMTTDEINKIIEPYYGRPTPTKETLGRTNNGTRTTAKTNRTGTNQTTKARHHSLYS